MHRSRRRLHGRIYINTFLHVIGLAVFTAFCGGGGLCDFYSQNRLTLGTAGAFLTLHIDYHPD